MQKISHILSFVLIAQLLVATSGPPLVYNFCGEKLYSVSIGSSDLPNCSDENNPNEEQYSTDECCQQDQQDMCRSEIHVSTFHPDGILNSSLFTATILAANCSTILSHSLILIAAERHTRYSFQINSHPPARSSDRPILFRSLLI